MVQGVVIGGEDPYALFDDSGVQGLGRKQMCALARVPR
jgi:hypothetical protein